MMTSWHREAPVPAAGSTSIVELAMNKLVPTTVSSRSTVLIGGPYTACDQEQQQLSQTQDCAARA